MITIDGKEIEFTPGETIMQVADRLGVHIPRMCHKEGLPTFTSCMVCQVRDESTGAMMPACSIPARDELLIDTTSDSVLSARRTAIELLLSEHLGDCEGPCTVFCPAGMDIPLMIRQIAAGEFAAALATVKTDIALPAVLGRVCSAPCEKACRRSFQDQAVSICKLKRFVADVDLRSDTPWLPERLEMTGKSVVVIGGGPMGLAAAWHLSLAGHAVTLLDGHDDFGGGLRYGLPDGLLDTAVLDREIDLILSLGMEVRLMTELGRDVSLDGLLESFDAVALCFQPNSKEVADELGLPTDSRGVIANKLTFATPTAKLFSRPGLASKSKMSIRAVAAGKGLAHSVTASFDSRAVERPPFNSVFGKPKPKETALFMAGVSDSDRVECDDGLPTDAAIREATRCLHCDCRGKDACSLRDLASESDAKQKRFAAEERSCFETMRPLDSVIHEPGKCIRCGICVRICENHDLHDGFTFLQRGYDVRVGTPFNRPISEENRVIVLECVDACPTGALSLDPVEH